MAKILVITIEAIIDENQYNEKLVQGYTPNDIKKAVHDFTEFSFPYLPIVDGEIVSVAMKGD